MNYTSKKEIKFDFDDILIEFADTSEIESRDEVCPYDCNEMLPLITAPMDTVVDSKSIDTYLGNKINVCTPRREKNYLATSIGSRHFISYSLSEFEDIYIKGDGNEYSNILIDIANGHMKKLLTVIANAKEKYGQKLFIMAGNIGTPRAYMELSEAGADAIRLGIGNGNGCTTTKNGACGYPMGSLIHECYHQSISLDNPALIIADGGMKDYEDIIKAIALGADYVMVGSIFNKALDSCGPTYFKGIKINQHGKFAKWAHKNKFQLIKKFRGMSTKEVQRAWGNKILKTSEGVVRKRPVEYTIAQWTENFTHYLKSTMSYTNCKTLDEFRGGVDFNMISQNSRNRFNK